MGQSLMKGSCSDLTIHEMDVIPEILKLPEILKIHSFSYDYGTMSTLNNSYRNDFTFSWMFYSYSSQWFLVQWIL